MDAARRQAAVRRDVSRPVRGVARRAAGGARAAAEVERRACRRATCGRHPGCSIRTLVWEHNVGSGSPEEGVYHGREAVLQLFERILEPWETCASRPTRSAMLEDESFLLTGHLHAKHATSETVVVAPYEQQLEMRDGLLVKGTDDERRHVRWVTSRERRDRAPIHRRVQPRRLRLAHRGRRPGRGAVRVAGGAGRSDLSRTRTGCARRSKSGSTPGSGCRSRSRTSRRSPATASCSRFTSAPGARGSGIEVEITGVQRLHVPRRKGDAHSALHEREPALEAAGLTPDYQEEKR